MSNFDIISYVFMNIPPRSCNTFLSLLFFIPFLIFTSPHQTNVLGYELSKLFSLSTNATLYYSPLGELMPPSVLLFLFIMKKAPHRGAFYACLGNNLKIQ